jgi:hypothetical protein
MRWHRPITPVLGHMLLPSLRSLVRHQARSVPLLPQCRLKSTDSGLYGFADFRSWARKNQNRGLKPTQSPRSGSVKAHGGRSLRTRGARRAKEPKAQTREQRILKTVAQIVGGEKPLGAVTNGLPGEDWKTDDWGLDSMLSLLSPVHRLPNWS